MNRVTFVVRSLAIGSSEVSLSAHTSVHPNGYNFNVVHGLNPQEKNLPLTFLR